MQPLPLAEHELLEVIGWHRYLTRRQCWKYERPQDANSRPTYALLGRLVKRGLVGSGQVDGRGVAVYFLTPAGIKALPPPLRRDYQPTAEQAGFRYRHTWQVNEAGLAFVQAARDRGDECGPLALEHERRLRDTGDSASLLIADGILQYALQDSKTYDPRWAILEVDRRTAPGRICDRLRAYATIKRKKALWSKVLPDGWPPVLFVISADPSSGPRVGEKHWAGDPKASSARTRRLTAYVADRIRDESMLRGLDVFFAPLPALLADGPFAPIWHRPGHAEPLDWLGRPVMSAVSEGGAA
jgi:DNA-binding PadR family transcriptional regulator